VLFVKEFLLNVWLGVVAQKRPPVSQAITSVEIKGSCKKILNK
jgi:hypothetical protein